MRVSERQVIAHRVLQYYQKHGMKETVRHFAEEEEKPNTIRVIINRCLRTGSSEFKPKPGRSRTVATPEVVKAVKKKLINRNTSERVVAKEVGISDTTVHRIKSEHNIKTHKCIETPSYENDQADRAQNLCRKLYRKSSKKVFILDDETYVPADPKQVHVRKFYNFTDKSKVPNSVRFKPKAKFPKKFLVWQVIDELGNVSKPYVKLKSMKSDEYLEECLKKILLPFIQKYHSDSDVLFWPDLASIHYSKDV